MSQATDNFIKEIKFLLAENPALSAEFLDDLHRDITTQYAYFACFDENSNASEDSKDSCDKADEESCSAFIKKWKIFGIVDDRIMSNIRQSSALIRKNGDGNQLLGAIIAAKDAANETA